MKKIYCLKCGAERYGSVEACPMCGSRESTDSLDEYLERSGCGRSEQQIERKTEEFKRKEREEKDHNADETGKERERATTYVCPVCGYVYETNQAQGSCKCRICGCEMRAQGDEEKRKAEEARKQREQATRFVCPVCGYVYETNQAQKSCKCPICGCEMKAQK